MKGIGIEKLGELLREYSYKNHDYHWTLYVSGEVEGSVPGTDHDLSNEEMGMVIKSKEYGFIKWLVENEKIEWEKVYENLKDYEVEIRIRAVKKLQLSSEKKSLWYLELLMLLSIQDEPIKFLISILK